MSHPTTRLDPAIHQPARLGILTAAAETKRIDFVSLRDLLDLTDGNLSRHLSTLEDAGYITIEKMFDGRKPRTWVSATKAGRKALNEEIAALREIIGAVDSEPGVGPIPAPSPAPGT
jgi:DNA-binding MarR family transcriptional regulator